MILITHKVVGEVKPEPTEVMVVFEQRQYDDKRNWIQHVNRMPRNRLPRVMKRYSPTGRRNRGRPLKRLLDT